MVYRVVSIDADRYPPTLEPAILAEAGAELIAKQCHSELEIVAAGLQADAVLVALSKVSRLAIESWRRVRVIVRYGVGFDNIDLDAATQRGIAVANVPDYCTEEVADTAFSFLLALKRKLVEMHNLVRLQVYDRRLAAPLFRLRGQTLGVIGFGRIGQAVARRAIPFGLNLLVHDPYLQPSDYLQLPVQFTGLQELLEKSDIVSLRVPLNSETHHLIGAPQLRQMKSETILINTSRGGVVDQISLYEAIRDGRIAGAGLDVLEKEPPTPGDPLLGLGNVLITPHYGAMSEESQPELRIKAARQIVQALRGERPPNLLNPEVLNRNTTGNHARATRKGEAETLERVI
jgi:D-3-phosphoglycerate dehydrogenase